MFRALWQHRKPFENSQQMVLQPAVCWSFEIPGVLLHEPDLISKKNVASLRVKTGAFRWSHGNSKPCDIINSGGFRKPVITDSLSQFLVRLSYLDNLSKISVNETLWYPSCSRKHKMDAQFFSSLNPMSSWLPSQNGLFFELPQRQSVQCSLSREVEELDGAV